VAVLVALCVPTSARAASPEDTVRTTADKALQILADKGLSNQQKTDQLSTLMDGVSDFETTSKLVLARGWKDFSDSQRKEFQELLRDYLIARYRSRIDEYAGQTVQIVNGREEARGDYTVQTRVQTPGKQPIQVDYRMRKDPRGDWRVIDIIGEDISVVSNLRSQFQSMLSQGGPDKLLKSLRDKIASGQAAADNQQNTL
jgi:phospholipid transport system substrate-binding protein